MRVAAEVARHWATTECPLSARAAGATAAAALKQARPAELVC